MIAQQENTYSAPGKPDIVTEMSVMEAIGILQDLPPLKRSSFAGNLLKSWKYRGLTEKQTYWTIKLALEAKEGKPMGSAPFSKTRGGLPRKMIPGIPKLYEFMAAAKPKFPALTFAVSPDLTIKIAMRRNKNDKWAGCLNVSNGEKYGSPDNKFFGRIHPNGEFEMAPKCNDSVVSTVEYMCADLPGFIRDYGKRSGFCCFCNSKLDDEKQISSRLGYGPTCAKNFGLPHSKKAAEEADKFVKTSYLKEMENDWEQLISGEWDK